METRPDLTGQIAMVTGGAGGIGRAVAARLARRGALVVVADLDADAADEAAGEIGGTALSFDVASRSAWEAAVESIETDHGRIDKLVLNAGVMSRPKGISMSEGDPIDWMAQSYERVRGVNLDGVVYGIIAALPLLADGSSIAVTSSMSGLAPRVEDPAYGMTKAASIALVRATASSLADRNVSISAVCPAGIDTSMVPPDVRTSDTVLAPADHIAEAIEYVLDLAPDQTGGIWLTSGVDDPLRRHEFPDVR